MLVLTRKKSEMIQIGNDVVIKVIKTGSGTVKLGIDAPAHIRVLRSELCDHDDQPSTASRNGHMEMELETAESEEEELYLEALGHLPAIAVLAADA